MSKFTVDFTALEDLKGDLRRAQKKAKLDMRRVLLEWARLTRTTAIKGIMESVPHGRTYQRSNPSRVHVASAPGQPPAVDMATFVNSIYLARTKNGYRVGSRDFRAAMFETGAGKMAPRPWLTPAQAEANAQLPAIIDRYVRPFK